MVAEFLLLELTSEKRKLVSDESLLHAKEQPKIFSL